MTAMKISIPKLEKAIGSPSKNWVGNCHSIATKVEKAKVFPGAKATYGNFLGTSHSDSIFSGRPFTHHGWLVIRKDGVIIDPTWWAIMDPHNPALHVTDIDDDDYDEAGAKIRSEHSKPYPKPGPKGKKIKITFTRKEARAISVLAPMDADHFRKGSVLQSELFWLANQSPFALGDQAKGIFKKLCKAKLGAFVPIDVKNILEI